MLLVSHHKTATKWVTAVLEEHCTRNGATFSCAHLSRDYSDGFDHFFNQNAFYDYVPKSALRVVHIIRNPLDMLVSAYYSHLHSHDTTGWAALEEHRKVLLACGREAGLIAELSFLTSHNFFYGNGEVEVVPPLASLELWDWDDPCFLTVRMEDLTVRPLEQFTRMFEFAEEETPSDLSDSVSAVPFEKLSGGRSKGQKDDRSHYRSGVPNEWRSELPTYLVEAMRAKFRDILERFYPDALA